MKKGISLIVLVITIIVMIILAASVVVSLNNTGIINKANEAVNLTDERQVQDMAALIWAECYLDPSKKNNLENEVKEELEKQGITEDEWNITVTETGVTVTNKNIDKAKPGTLGYLVKDANDYGKLVDYTVTVDGTTYDKWQVFYEDKTNGYVFLILEDMVSYDPWDYSVRVLPSELTANENNLYNTFKLGKVGFVLTDANDNCKMVGGLIREYSIYANTTETYKDYVVGAIGSPTIELFAASYNEKHPENKIKPIIDLNAYDEELTGYEGSYYYNGANGYFINQIGPLENNNFTNDEPYKTDFYNHLATSNYYLASPGSHDNGEGAGYILVFVEGHFGNADGGGCRPVVCLKSDVPATAGTGDYDFSLTK